MKTGTVKADIGVYGLAVMGSNLALNMADKGFTVAVYNRPKENYTESFAAGQARGIAAIIPTYTIEEFVRALEPPRKVLIMIQAGSPVDDALRELTPCLEKGDIIIDSGNTHFQDSMRRCAEISRQGLLYIGAGVSGGEEGARHGPAITPGGSREAYAHVAPILTKISAQVNGEPCCAYIGGDGAGHYVKTVHNGIEYGTMQLAAEAYFLMKSALGMATEEIAATLDSWNKGSLDSYVIATTATILHRKDPVTGTNPLVEMILDKAGQKGTGLWTQQSALELHVPVPTIAAGIDARCISALKDERMAAAKILTGPDIPWDLDRRESLGMIHDAVYASMLCAYAQGFALMAKAGQHYHWDLDLPRIARIWRGGCILQAHFLDRISAALAKQPDLPNLIVEPWFAEILNRAQAHWRRLVCLAAERGLPIPAISASLCYYDSYRRERLPANLIQAQRDCFGKHLYERTDRKGLFHFEWLADHGTESLSAG